MIIVPYVPLIRFSVRLVDGIHSYEGRVEVNYQGEWGTVCGDGWDLNNADVICRQLGYPSASQAWQRAHFGQGSGLILLDEVSCSGSESDISDCRHDGWFNNDCGHGEDAGVTCVDTDVPSLEGMAQDCQFVDICLNMLHSQIKS